MQRASTPPPAADVSAQIGVTPPGSPQQVYRALRSQREILGEQLGTAQRLRSNLIGQLGNDNQTASTRAGLERRIVNVDERIASLDKQIAQSDAAVAQAAATPGATFQPPPAPRSNLEGDEKAALGALFMVIVMLPMSIAFARRVWRRSARAEVTLPQEVSQRMESLERGVEAIALEVERIGEGQRFVTAALVERGERVEARALQ